MCVKICSWDGNRICNKLDCLSKLHIWISRRIPLSDQAHSGHSKKLLSNFTTKFTGHRCRFHYYVLLRDFLSLIVGLLTPDKRRRMPGNFILIPSRDCTLTCTGRYYFVCFSQCQRLACKIFWHSVIRLNMRCHHLT